MTDQNSNPTKPWPRPGRRIYKGDVDDKGLEDPRNLIPMPRDPDVEGPVEVRRLEGPTEASEPDES